MIFGIDNVENQKTALALGMFDGIHVGHKVVLQNAINSGLFPIAVTFFDNQSNLLMSPQKKKDTLLGMGFKQVVMMNYDAVRSWLPLPYLSSLRINFDPQIICCGENFRFGINACGDVDMLVNYCRSHEIEALVSRDVKDENGELITSTSIRKMVADGRIEEANKLMINDFSYTQTVLRGDGVGHVLGFPTINQELPAELVVPKFGVYAAKVSVNDKVYDAVTNIGVRPTRPSDKPICETHIIGFEGDIYDNAVTVRLKKYLREEQKFSDQEQLAEAIRNDIKTVEKEK